MYYSFIGYLFSKIPEGKMLILINPIWEYRYGALAFELPELNKLLNDIMIRHQDDFNASIVFTLT